MSGIGSVTGGVDYTQDGLAKNIPWAFSKKTVAKFYDASVCPQTSNTDYEGEIKGSGDKVIINTIPTVSITRNYRKGGTVNWQSLSSPAVTLEIDKSSSFAFRFDKVDLYQFAIDLMEKCSQDAGEQMRIDIDEQYLGDIYSDAAAANKGLTAGRKSSLWNLGTTGTPVPLSKTNIIDYIMMCEAVADEQNWPDSDRWMVLPTWAKFLVNVSELKDASLTGADKSHLTGGGYVGMIGKFRLYGTNLYTAVTDGANSCYNITFGHKSGVTFAAQLTEMEYHDKFENTFGRGMKGLQVYGWKVAKAESVGVLYAYKA